MLTWNSGMAGTASTIPCRAVVASGERASSAKFTRLSEQMRTRMTVTLLAAAVLLAYAPAAGAKTFPPHYEVGIATRSINPAPDGKSAGQPVYLGGYGIGGGSPVFEGRPATGVLRGGVDVRAIVIGGGNAQGRAARR